MDIARLRSSTASDHQSVEDSVPLMDSSLNVETYVRVLARLRDIVSAWESQLTRQANGVVATLASHRARLPLIEADLNKFERNGANSGACSLPVFDTEAQLLGAMYMMEGSRLGGQLIAKHVESKLGFEGGQGTSYFRGFEERTSVMWKEFLEALNTTIPEESTDEMIVGAKKMFTAFGACMRQSEAVCLFGNDGPDRIPI